MEQGSSTSLLWEAFWGHSKTSQEAPALSHGLTSLPGVLAQGNRDKTITECLKEGSKGGEGPRGQGEQL